MNVQAAIDRGLRTVESIEINRARIRGDFDALFLLVGFGGLDVIIAAERQRLAERYAARVNDQGFIA